MQNPNQFRLLLMGAVSALVLAAMTTPATASVADATATSDAAATGSSGTLPPGDATDIGQVIVTAQKRSENVQKVPMSISVLSASAIKERGVDNIIDVQNEIPGFKFGEYSTSANVSIRGVGTAFVSGAGQSSVAVYIDNVYLARLYSFSMGQYDLSFIEVLKGPQGTLYGRNSTAGVANFTTTAPTSVFSAGATVGIGNYSDKKAAGFVSGPILGDKVRARLYLDSEEHDGIVENTYTGRHVDDLHAFGGRLSVDADLTDWWTASLRFSQRRLGCACFNQDLYDPSVIPLYGAIPPTAVDFDPYKIKTPVNSSGARTDGLLSLTNTFKVSDSINLVSITAYHDFRDVDFFDALGNAAVPFPIRYATHDKTFTEELDLKGNTRLLQWIAGLYYFNDEVASRAQSDLSDLPVAFGGLGAYHTTIGPIASSIIEQTNLPSSREESEAVFGDATYEVKHGTRVYAGARVTYDRVVQKFDVVTTTPFTPPIESCSYVGNPEVPPDPAIFNGPQVLSSTALTGRIGAQQDVGDHAMAYLQYSRGYKSPNFSQSECNNPFKAETNDAFEVGYKSQWLGGKLTLDTAAFYYKIDNLQLEQVALVGISVVNAPKAHVYGAEGTLIYKALDNLRFDANVELSSSAYDRFYNTDANFGVPSCIPPGDPQTGAGCPAGSNLKGIQLDNAPTASGTLGAEYDHRLEGFGGVTFRAETSLTTSYHLREFDVPAAIQSGYALWDFTLTYHPPNDHYQVRAYVKNATDVARLAGINGYTGYIGSYQPPRTFGVEASVKY